MALQLLLEEASCEEVMVGDSLPSSLSTTVRRALLWGIPSLTLLGLAGVVSWRWFSRSSTSSRAGVMASTSPAACTRSTSRGTSKRLSASERSPTSEDSGVVDTGSHDHGSGKTSEEEDNTEQVRALPHTHRASKLSMRRSSNLPPETETPLRPPAVPSIENDYADTDSTSSSEGLLSVPYKSPPDHNISASDKTSTEASSGKKVSSSSNNHSSSSSNDEAQKPSSGDDSTTTTTTTTTAPSSAPDQKQESAASKKDRLRVTVRIPRAVVGRFIGKQGRNIKALMADSHGAYIYVNQKNVPSDAQVVLCTIQGTSDQVEEALKIIEVKYPEIDLPTSSGGGYGSPPQQHIAPFPCPLFSAPNPGEDPWEVSLLPAIIPAKPFSATTSFIEDVTDLWLVTWDKCMEVDRMHSNMSYMYKRLYPDGQDAQSHAVAGNDEGLLGKFCAVRVSNIHWLRGCVARFGDCADSYEVQLVDYGSMVLVPASSVKPLRREYTILPVQAFKSKIAHVECRDTAVVQDGMIWLQKTLEGQMMEVHVTSTFPLHSTSAGPSGSSAEAGATEGSKPPPPSAKEEEVGKHLDQLVFPTALSPSVAEVLAAPEAASESPICAAATSPKEAAAQPSSGAAAVELVEPEEQAVKAVVAPPLAQCVPMVELYVQQGAQTPVFVNRELVELGFASWKEDSLQTSSLVVHKSTADS